ncbi:hypothetical protein A3Q56_07388 [Intoshia linei]|uniref:Uncharacterized protein n=1 Tax=Intoshia linei TaxID=1819745 RepID=A0A177ASC3_9BILA|nr:hypothetical protein A3Q56_07388 [Intoshia linei]
MAKTKQELIAEQMNIKIVEKKQDIQIAKQEIFRNENELNSTIKQPALAQMYKKKLMAETEKNMMIKKAEAEADSIRMRAVAEAETIKAQSISESENMTRRAKAWEVYKKEARVDLLLKVLPEIVENITKNLNETDKIIMISNGDDKIGIEKITNEVMTVVEALPKMVERMSGIEFI